MKNSSVEVSWGASENKTNDNIWVRLTKREPVGITKDNIHDSRDLPSCLQLLPSRSEENEVLSSGSILEGILCPRHFR